MARRKKTNMQIAHRQTQLSWSSPLHVVCALHKINKFRWQSLPRLSLSFGKKRFIRTMAMSMLFTNKPAPLPSLPCAPMPHPPTTRFVVASRQRWRCFIIEFTCITGSGSYTTAATLSCVAGGGRRARAGRRGAGLRQPLAQPCVCAHSAIWQHFI